MVKINLHRAYVGTRAAQAAREGERLMLLRVAVGVDDRANWPGNANAVTMTAAAAIHWAGVQARAAANAAQRVAKVVAGQQARAAVVHQHDVQLAPRPRAVVVRAVRGDRLPRRRPS